MLWVALHLPALSLESWRAGAPADARPAVLIADHRVQHADAAAPSAWRARGHAARHRAGAGA
jgi:outer membrane biogenesis lipoprotein LolB